MKVKIYSEGPLPYYQTKDSAGMDLHSNIDYVLAPGETKIIPSGIHIQLPDAPDGFRYEAQVRSRSGLAAKRSIHVLNAPGTIDKDFTGEIGIILHNGGANDFEIKVGDRIAQLVFNMVVVCEWDRVYDLEDFDKTERGDGGFGSSGK